MDSPLKTSTLPRPSGLPRPSRLPIPQSTCEPSVPNVPSKYRLTGTKAGVRAIRDAEARTRKPIHGEEAVPEAQAQAIGGNTRIAQGFDGANETAQEDARKVEIREGVELRRRPRPSLSDRTIETLSQIPPTPSPRRRKSSFFCPESPAGTPSRPPSLTSRPRPVTSLGQRPPIPPMAPRATSPTKRPVSPVKTTPSQRAVSSYVQSSTKVRSSDIETTPSKASRSTNATVLQPAAANKLAKPDSRPIGASKTYGARSSKSRPAVEDLFKKPAMPSTQTRRDVSSLSTNSAQSTDSASIFSTSTSRKSSQASQTSNEGRTQPSSTLSSVSKSSAALRETIAKAKAERRKAVGAPTGNSPAEEPFLPSESNRGILRKRVDMARIDGRLNIAAMGLSDFPEEVLKMYDLDTLNVSGSAWYESVDITRLTAADNSFRTLNDTIFPDQSSEALASDDEEMKGNIFGALEFLDLHGNLLVTVPVGLRRLEYLTVLNVSNNRLSNDSIDTIGQIKTLKELRIAENALRGTLSRSVFLLEHLEVLDIHSNAITDLPEGVADLLDLRVLDVAGNQLRSLPFGQLSSLPLTDLNASRNKLVGTLLPEFFEGMPLLRALDISGNAVTSICQKIISFPTLQSFSTSENRLTELPDISDWLDLTTLSAANNNISVMPAGFTSLPKLRNVDFAGNSLKKLDDRIGMMESLVALSLGNNPLRDRRFLTMGTDDVKNELRNRLFPQEPEVSNDPHIATDSNSQEAIFTPTRWPVKPGGILDRSSTSLKDVNPSDLDHLIDTPIRTFAFHHNQLNSIPSSIDMHASTLTTLDLSHNKLSGSSYLSKSLFLPSLQELNLASNTINSLSPLVTCFSAPALQTVNVSFNRITALPVLRDTYPSLTTLLACDNAIPELPVECAKGLQVLDVCRNDIPHLEPQLGLLEVEGLKMLGVEGNRFRVPRREVVEKGSEAVMEWLRGRIADV